jgi:hypothetical protein
VLEEAKDVLKDPVEHRLVHEQCFPLSISTQARRAALLPV